MDRLHLHPLVKSLIAKFVLVVLTMMVKVINVYILLLSKSKIAVLTCCTTCQTPQIAIEVIALNNRF